MQFMLVYTWVYAWVYAWIYTWVYTWVNTWRPFKKYIELGRSTAQARTGSLGSKKKQPGNLVGNEVLTTE